MAKFPAVKSLDSFDWGKALPSLNKMIGFWNWRVVNTSSVVKTSSRTLPQ